MEPARNEDVRSAELQLTTLRTRLAMLLDEYDPAVGLAAMTTLLAIIINASPNPMRTQHQIMRALRTAVKETKNVREPTPNQND